MNFFKEKNQDTGYSVTCIYCGKEFTFEGEPYCSHCNQELYPIYYAQKMCINTGFRAYNVTPNYSYIKFPENLDKVKGNKKVTILGKELELTDKERQFAILYLTFMKAANNCANDIKNIDQTVITGRLSIDVKAAYRRAAQFAYEMISFFNDHTKENINNEVLAFITSYVELMQEFVQKQEYLEEYFIDQIHNATSQLSSSMASIQARAIGREAGILCASDSLFMSAVGTYATKSILEDESKSALSTHSAALTNITDERTKVYVEVFHTIMKQAVLNLLTLLFSRDFGEEEILNLTTLLCKDFKELDNKEIFFKYPFIHTTHLEIINELKNEEDIQAFSEIIKYFDIEQYEQTMLENLASSDINIRLINIDRLTSPITYEYFNFIDSLNLLNKLLNADTKELIRKNVYKKIKDYIYGKNLEMGLFNKKKIRNQIEEKFNIFCTILSISDIQKLRLDIK